MYNRPHLNTRLIIDDLSISYKLVHQENNYGDTKEIENQKEEREEGVQHSIL